MTNKSIQTFPLLKMKLLYGIIISFLTIIFINVAPVGATNAYINNAILLAPSFTITHGMYSHDLNYQEFIAILTNTCTQSTSNGFNTMQNFENYGHYYSISRIQEGTAGDWSLRFLWSNESTVWDGVTYYPSTYWFPDGAPGAQISPQSANGYSGSATIRVNTSGDYACTVPYYDGANSQAISENHNYDDVILGLPSPRPQYNVELIMSNFPVEYPTGYTGTLIPDTIIPPDPEPTNFGFTAQASGLFMRFSGHAEDNEPLTRFLWSFDGSDNFINYNPTDVTTTNENDTTTALYSWQNTDGSWTTSQYVTNLYTEVKTVNVCMVAIDSTGQEKTACKDVKTGGTGFFNSQDVTPPTVTTTVEDCGLTAEFPFIRIDGCLESLQKATKLMTFQPVSFGQSWYTDSKGCHTLTVLNTWLNLPENYQICPQIPENVRNVITPFITFLLGLLAVKFLTKGKSE